MTWSPPNKERQNGKIRGYKISYISGEDFYDKAPTVATTTNQYFTIDNARKYTNYTITVLAFTSIGDGVKTNNFHCVTLEDGEDKLKFVLRSRIYVKHFSLSVPSAPQSIKAIPSSSTKIIVSWLPPRFKNGEIVSLSSKIS